MFRDREDAGRQLAIEIKETLKDSNYIVAGIVRGGVVVAKVVAEVLDAELKGIVVRKLGSPLSPELAIGAVGSNQIVYWDENLIKKLNIKKGYKERVLAEQYQEVKNLEEKFSISRKNLDFANSRVIIVDDGVATGATVLCALKVLKSQNALEVLLAVPVISNESFDSIKRHFDRVIVLKKEREFSAVGQFYRDFPQVEDEEVVKILNIK